MLSEAIKLAVVDRIRWCGDPKFSPVPLDQLLSDAYAASQRERIDRESASPVEGERWGGFREGDFLAPGKIDGLTTHLAAVDADGNVPDHPVAGQRLRIGSDDPRTGVLLNNFVYWSEPTRVSDPNRIKPGKRWSVAWPRSRGRRKRLLVLDRHAGQLRHPADDHADVVEHCRVRCRVQAAIEAPRFRVWEDTGCRSRTVSPPTSGEVGGPRTRAGGHRRFLPQVGGARGDGGSPSGARGPGGPTPGREGYALAY
ncbi:MAG: hypothetical protein Ct9H300mP1_31530 [Planctomycetaceae bacterium]|nr:MAG: hypothetical protein Ct9H300mP1_31530 [Planctomycetaceae bacterium]